MRGRVEALPGETPARIVKMLDVLERSGATMEEATGRVDEMVRRMRSFARLDEARVQHVSLARCVEDAIAVVSHRVPDDVAIVVEAPAQDEVRGDPASLNQLIVNVLNNAVDAVGDAGRIDVRLRLDEDVATLVIEDDGAGMTEEAVARAFDPGFTTKGVGVGAGLGLAIAYQIAEQHDGGITIASEGLGRGSTVTLQLPQGEPA